MKRAKRDRSLISMFASGVTLSMGHKTSERYTKQEKLDKYLLFKLKMRTE